MILRALVIVALAASVTHGAEPIVSMTCHKTMGNALADLSKEAGVEIRVDDLELKQHGITKNQNVKVDIRIVPFRKALEAILMAADPKNRLTYYFVEKDGAVVVTTKIKKNKILELLS
jgi:hypothetical protein